MKKLKLNLVNLQGAQVLSREQLKKVMGGDDGSGGSGSGSGDATVKVDCIAFSCRTDADCGSYHVCRTSVSCPWQYVCAKPIWC